jgi:hypothetical protein
VVVPGMRAKVIGVILLALGGVLGPVFLLQSLYVRRIKKDTVNAVRDSRAWLETHLGETRQLVTEYTARLVESAERTGAAYDVKAISGGYIAMQQAAFCIDSVPLLEKNATKRMAIQGHVPSYVRGKPLTLEIGKKIFASWNPPDMIPEYVSLVNQRRTQLHALLDHGCWVKDIYHKSILIDYAKKGYGFPDAVEDPNEEIYERLSFMLQCLDLENYHLSLLEKDMPGTHFLLRPNVGLVLDLRTSSRKPHFSDSIQGLQTNSLPVLAVFESKFDALWRVTKKDEARKFLKELLSLRDTAST